MYLVKSRVITVFGKASQSTVSIFPLTFAYKNEANFLFYCSEFDSNAWQQLSLFLFDINRFKPIFIIYQLNDFR